MTRPITGRVVPEQRRTSGAPAPGQPPVPGPGTARIAVDLLGGDHAPAVVVDGALRACQADPALQLLLVGPVEAAGEVLAALDPGPAVPGVHGGQPGHPDRTIRRTPGGSSPAYAAPCWPSPSVPPTPSSRPATPAPPSPPPRSAWAAGRTCAGRPWPPCCPPRPAGWCCSTSGPRSTRTSRRWLRTPGWARRTPGSCTICRARASGCSPSAPNAARATSCAEPPRPRWPQPICRPVHATSAWSRATTWSSAPPPTWWSPTVSPATSCSRGWRPRTP